MRATNQFFRLFIRGLAWDATAASATFAATLNLAARSRLTDSAKGKVLIGAGSGTTTVTYTLPPMGSLSADDIAQVCSQILDQVDVIKAGSPSITDADLLIALLALYPAQPIRSVRQDFSCGFSR